MADDKMLQEAIEAVANGHRDRARDLLTRLLRANQSNPKYWLWMSSVVESAKERKYCLQKTIQLEPGNRAAKLGLILEGVASPGEGMQPGALRTRDWKASYKTTALESRSKKMFRTLAYVGASLLVLGFISLGILGPRISRAGNYAGVQLTVTPVFETIAATATLLPTNTPRVVTPTPTFIGPTPLWMFLEATYTPTPLYINTPHPITEAYKAGIRAFQNGDFEEMVFFMEQAVRSEPDSEDIYYYLGEAYRLSGELEQALFAYEKAVETNQNFAPAYLGRAIALTAIDPDFDIESDLTVAASLDPFLAAAHLDLIAYYLSIDDIDQSLALLETAKVSFPESPLVYAYLSQALMAAGDYENALAAAETAYQLDQTILSVYRTLGELNLISGKTRQARHFLEIYLRYVKDESESWANYGQALIADPEQIDQAMQAFNLALDLDENSISALLYRGYAYLELGEGQLAVNDLFIARNLDRESFEASFGLARALSLSERYEDAISQFKGSEQLASSEDQKAGVYYWRAQTFKQMDDVQGAVANYSALLDLQSETISEEWIEEAHTYLFQLTPTPTMTNSPPPPTETPTVVPPTSSPTWTPGPTQITPSPTKTMTATPTQVKPTPSTTPRPTQTSRPRE